MIKFLRIKCFAHPWFCTSIDFQHNQISYRVESWKYEGSIWTIDSILQHTLVISENTPCEGSSFLLPKELRYPLKVLINMQNKYNVCFRSDI